MSAFAVGLGTELIYHTVNEQWPGRATWLTCLHAIAIRNVMDALKSNDPAKGGLLGSPLSEAAPRLAAPKSVLAHMRSQ